MDWDICCAYFDRPDQNGRLFRRMARVLKIGVDKHCPEASFNAIEDPEPPKMFNMKQNAIANWSKVASWCRYIRDTDQPTLLLDADTLIVRPVAEIWERDFDIAYCRRPGPFPLIGGVVFVKPTDAAQKFVTEWLITANAILRDPDTCQMLMSEYGGLSQSCLNILTSDMSDEVDFLELDAVEWNCCDEVWHQFDEERTRIVHYKGPLRRELVCGDPGDLEKYDHQTPEVYAQLCNLWFSYAQEMYEQVQKTSDAKQKVPEAADEQEVATNAPG